MSTFRACDNNEKKSIICSLCGKLQRGPAWLPQGQAKEYNLTLILKQILMKSSKCYVEKIYHKRREET